MQLDTLIRDTSGKTLSCLVGPNISDDSCSKSDFYFHNDTQVLEAYYPTQRVSSRPLVFPARELFDRVSL